MTTRTTTLGEHVAETIAEEMTRLGWDFDDLARATGGEVSWGELAAHRADARDMDIVVLSEIAHALGLKPLELVQGW